MAKNDWIPNLAWHEWVVNVAIITVLIYMLQPSYHPDHSLRRQRRALEAAKVEETERDQAIPTDSAP